MMQTKQYKMIVALARFQELDEKCIFFLEAAETGQREMTLTKRSIREDIAASEVYVTASDNLCSKQVDTLK